MKVATIVGARPQFIKAAPVSRALHQAGHRELLIHTGQHYDYKMSKIFFEELGIPEPDINLEVGSGPHGWQTGQILMRLEATLVTEMPDWVLVYGDTNSTLAGALAACKLHLLIAHVEAGLRSFNRDMPEEHNRVLTDHCADLLFCPTQTAINNLIKEGLTKGVHWVGDTMYDAVLQFVRIAHQRSTILGELKLEPKSYLLATLHRPYNTDIPENLINILTAFQAIDEPIIFPLHPRTRKKIAELDQEFDIEQVMRKVQVIEPVGYLDMLLLEQNARLILTDSGGIQKEAYFFGVPCLTLRPETEWVETVETGWNMVAGAEVERIVAAKQELRPNGSPPPIFGDGRASERVVSIMEGVR
jgi:UDP-N-acetylglucosamine 2-epimerase